MLVTQSKKLLLFSYETRFWFLVSGGSWGERNSIFTAFWQQESLVVTAQEDHTLLPSPTLVSIHLLTSSNGLCLLFSPPFYCGFAFTDCCMLVNYRVAEPLTSLSRLTTVGNACVEEKSSCVRVCGTKWLITSAMNWLKRLSKQFDEATMTQEAAKMPLCTLMLNSLVTTVL